MKKGGEVKRPAPPAALSRQEILWLEPHEGELPAMEKGGEVRIPASPAALSWQEILWLEPHEGQLPAMKKGGRSEDQLPPQQFRCRRTGGRSPTEGSCRP